MWHLPGAQELGAGVQGAGVGVPGGGAALVAGVCLCCHYFKPF